MSPAGQAFLKCAFAPPDFNTDPGRGIPDRFNGKALGTKHQYTGPWTFAAGKDYYLVVAPTPGVAMWYTSVDIGTVITSTNAQLTPVLYPDFPSLFGIAGGAGASNRTFNVEAFRYASTAVGIYPTSNQMQFAGSISVWKAPLRQGIESRAITLSATAGATASIDTIVLNGLETMSDVGRENYTESFIKGAYAISTCNQPEFNFKEIIEGLGRIPQVLNNHDATNVASNMFGALQTSVNQVYLGLGDMDSIIIKISTPAGAVNSAIVKTWACVEYKPQTSSPLYQYAGNSPPYDPVALEAYRRVAAELPVAVECARNAEFWARVKGILRSILSAVSNVPGPLGMAATGVGMLADGIDALFLS